MHRLHLLAALVSLPGLVAVTSHSVAQTWNWAQAAGGSANDQGRGIATDAGGNSYITGFFEDTALFGRAEPDQIELTTTGAEDIFVAKYDRDGSLLWATRAGGDNTDRGWSVAGSRVGSGAYVTGSFTSAAMFGEGEPNETELLGRAFQANFFLARYDRDGSLLWARSASFSGGGEARGVATDARGDAYVTGDFSGAATFGEGEPNEAELTATGGLDLLVAKYDRDGSLLWATSAGGSGGVNSTGIAADARGSSAYVTGQFSGTATFGEGEPNETELTATGGLDIFVAKFDRDGSLLWATSAGGSDNTFADGRGVAINNRGELYVTGLFGATAHFGVGEPSETRLTASGGEGDVDIFVAKYASDGALLWATAAGGVGFDNGGSIVTDMQGNSYVTGRFSDIATFGKDEPNEIQLTASGLQFDIFVAKYDRDGSLLWATSAGGNDVDAGTGITLSRPDKALVTGVFSDRAIFRNKSANDSIEISSAGRLDVFVAEVEGPRHRGGDGHRHPEPARATAP